MSVTTDPLVSPIAHVPGVFSHYSPKTGSALVTKVYQHTKALERAGGLSYVLINERRDASYDAGTIVRFTSPREDRLEWFTDRERRVDAVLGSTLGWRPMMARFYRPAIEAVPKDAAAIVVYNQPAAMSRRSLRHHEGTRVLHLGNDVFARWRSRDVVRALNAFDLVVAVSTFTAQSIQRRLPPDAPSIQVLRNGVDIDQFTPGKRSTDAAPEILFVGNMLPHKGAHHLLRAAAVLAARKVDFAVRIVGSWGLSTWDELTDYERSLRALAEPLGERVTFQPFVGRADIADTYRRARVFCMPVEWDEPAGQVVTEAMASGLPVVSARRGGIQEYLGPHGRYVDPSNPTELADQLETYLIDAALALEHGRALRDRAERMSWATRMRELDVLLKRSIRQ